jgi:hypothetical protein
VTVPYYGLSLVGLFLLAGFSMLFGWLTMDKEDYEDAMEGA